MKIKEKLTEMRDCAMNWWYDNSAFIGSLCAVGTVCLIVGGLYGTTKGLKVGRSEWDFSDQMYDGTPSGLLVDENMEYIAALPMTIIKEVLDAHKKTLSE